MCPKCLNRSFYNFFPKCHLKSMTHSFKRMVFFLVCQNYKAIFVRSKIKKEFNA